MKKSYHLIIKGKVQGVYYRDSTRQKAESLNVNGWVKNLSDGSVEAIIEGEEDNLQQLVEWCYEGPTFARVDEIEKKEVELEGFVDFKLRF